MPSSWSNPTGSAPCIPLSMLGPGESGLLVDVRGGWGIRQRLSAMGLTPGTHLTVMSDAGSAGPLIIEVMETRLALGRGMAHKIMVQPL